MYTVMSRVMWMYISRLRRCAQKMPPNLPQSTVRRATLVCRLVRYFHSTAHLESLVEPHLSNKPLVQENPGPLAHCRLSPEIRALGLFSRGTEEKPGGDNNKKQGWEAQTKDKKIISARPYHMLPYEGQLEGNGPSDSALRVENSVSKTG